MRCRLASHITLRHGNVFMVQRTLEGEWKLQLACDFEYLQALGFHVYPEACACHGVTDLLTILGTMAKTAMREMVGNGMHLVTQASWMYFRAGELGSQGAQVRDYGGSQVVLELFGGS